MVRQTGGACTNGPGFLIPPLTISFVSLGNYGDGAPAFMISFIPHTSGVATVSQHSWAVRVIFYAC